MLMGKYKMSVPVFPVMDLTSKPYWESLKNKHLRLQKCSGCGKHRFPPLPSCPYCGSQMGEWVSVSGIAKLYSWIVIHSPINPDLKEDIPYAVGLVELAEGPRMVGRILGCPPEEINKDMPVRFHYQEVNDDLTLLAFEQADKG